jgi:hypothetical protein
MAANKTAQSQHQLASMSSSAGGSTAKEQAAIPDGDDDTHPAVTCIRHVCGCDFDLQKEKLGYNYPAAKKYQTLKDEGKLTAGKVEPPPLPRIRRRGEFYLDSFNELPNGCSFGTHEEVSVPSTLLGMLLLLLPSLLFLSFSFLNFAALSSRRAFG